MVVDDQVVSSTQDDDEERRQSNNELGSSENIDRSEATHLKFIATLKSELENARTLINTQNA